MAKLNLASEHTAAAPFHPSVRLLRPILPQLEPTKSVQGIQDDDSNQRSKVPKRRRQFYPHATSKACDSCRQKKRKCDGSIPCSPCQQKAAEPCTYNYHENSRLSFTKHQYEALEDRIHELEAIINSLIMCSEDEAVSTLKRLRYEVGTSKPSVSSSINPSVLHGQPLSNILPAAVKTDEIGLPSFHPSLDELSDQWPMDADV